MEIEKKLREADTSEFPNFYSYQNPLEKGLWVLWVVKEKLQIKRLTAEQIASIIRDAKEVSINARAITNSFNRARDKVHTYKEGGEVYFEIMKPGKDNLISQAREGPISVYYFSPDKRFTSKRLLSKNILGSLKGELKIVDPYVGERTLDILKDIKDRNVKFLTKIDNLEKKEKTRFLNELRDFKSENKNMEFKDYPNRDIHDRYIISSDSLVLLGHSMKNLGSKESFAVVLSKGESINVVEALIESFDRRWRQSCTL